MKKALVPVMGILLVGLPLYALAEIVRTYRFQYEVGGRCVKVTVYKTWNPPSTRIVSEGYNVRCSDIANAGRAVQRTVQLIF